MNLTPISKKEFWEVEIKWSKPRDYERVRDHGTDIDADANFYMIIAKYSSNAPKIIYIGRTYNQTVCDRLNQDDHKRRYRKFKREFPRHSFQVVYGIIDMGYDRVTNNRIKEIEKILIYSSNTNHSRNISNSKWHGVIDSYSINNIGYKFTLPKYLYLGIFKK